MVILAMSPCIVKAFLKPQPKSVIRWVAYAYTCGFMFGWHVHEKASLHFTIPLGLIALNSLDDARHYFLLSIGMFLNLLFFFSSYPTVSFGCGFTCWFYNTEDSLLSYFDDFCSIFIIVRFSYCKNPNSKFTLVKVPM